MSKRDQDIDRPNSVLTETIPLLTLRDYLLAADGMTVSISNRKDPDSFLGKILSFPSYFRKRPKSQPGRDFAWLLRNERFLCKLPGSDR